MEFFGFLGSRFHLEAIGFEYFLTISQSKREFNLTKILSLCKRILSSEKKTIAHGTNSKIESKNKDIMQRSLKWCFWLN